VGVAVHAPSVCIGFPLLFFDLPKFAMLVKVMTSFMVERQFRFHFAKVAIQTIRYLVLPG